MSGPNPIHKISIVRPEERTLVRRSRTPMYVTVRQVLAAIQAVKVKGIDEFDSSHLANECGVPTQKILYGLYALEEHEVVVCTTPAKGTYRKWKVTDWEKAIQFRQALEGGQISLGEVEQEVSESIFQRILDAVSGRFTQARRLSALEDRLARMEARHNKLVRDLGGPE